jgi:hypothetical protein
LTIDTVPDVAGEWMVHCHVNDHFSAGMMAMYTASIPSEPHEPHEKTITSIVALVIIVIFLSPIAVYLSCGTKKQGTEVSPPVPSSQKITTAMINNDSVVVDLPPSLASVASKKISVQKAKASGKKRAKSKTRTIKEASETELMTLPAREEANIQVKNHPDFPAFLMRFCYLNPTEFDVLSLKQQEEALSEFQKELDNKGSATQQPNPGPTPV